jgi:hypothetical protein
MIFHRYSPAGAPSCLRYNTFSRALSKSFLFTRIRRSRSANKPASVQTASAEKRKGRKEK